MIQNDDRTNRPHVSDPEFRAIERRLAYRVTIESSRSSELTMSAPAGVLMTPKPAVALGETTFYAIAHGLAPSKVEALREIREIRCERLSARREG